MHKVDADICGLAVCLVNGECAQPILLSECLHSDWVENAGNPELTVISQISEILVYILFPLLILFTPESLHFFFCFYLYM